MALIYVKNFSHLLPPSLYLLVLSFVFVLCCGPALRRDMRVIESFNMETLVITNCEHDKLPLNVFGNLLTVCVRLIRLEIKPWKRF